jgi:hypothetical protein
MKSIFYVKFQFIDDYLFFYNINEAQFELHVKLTGINKKLNHLDNCSF